jgi:hypothetical protein
MAGGKFVSGVVVTFQGNWCCPVDEKRVSCCNCAMDTNLIYIQCHKCKDLFLCLEVRMRFTSN